MGFVKCNCGCGRTKPDPSKIKKVVIPETEVKMVCTLSFQKYRDGIKNRETDNTRYIELNPDTEFQRIEAPKPLADDEVSVEDVNQSNYHNLYLFSDCLYMLKLNEVIGKYYWGTMHDYAKVMHNYKIIDAIKDAIDDGNKLFYIEDQETLFQWCLDEARRAKGE